MRPLLLFLLVPSVAAAQDRGAENGSPATATKPPGRTFVFLEEPSLPSPLHVAAFTRTTFTSKDSARGFASNVAMPGATIEAGAELGLFPHVSIVVSGFDGGPFSSFGAIAGARVSLLPAAWKTRVVVSGGWVRELYSNDGVWGRVAASQDVGRFRFASTVHGEHVFAQGRDAIDLMVMLGANVRLADWFRVGIEYVAQDLEGLASDDAEGGMRHFVGPSASFSLLRERLTIGASPALGLSTPSPHAVGRFVVGYTF